MTYNYVIFQNVCSNIRIIQKNFEHSYHLPLYIRSYPQTNPQKLFDSCGCFSRLLHVYPWRGRQNEGQGGLDGDDQDLHSLGPKKVVERSFFVKMFFLLDELEASLEIVKRRRPVMLFSRNEIPSAD